MRLLEAAGVELYRNVSILRQRVVLRNKHRKYYTHSDVCNMSGVRVRNDEELGVSGLDHLPYSLEQVKGFRETTEFALKVIMRSREQLTKANSRNKLL